MKLSAIVITKNEQIMISDCLMSLKFADEIIVVDTGNTDNTNEIAKKHQAKIVSSKGTDYSHFRNDGLSKASGEWILYLDADERITPLLKNEILDTIQNPNHATAYAILRKNIFLGKHMEHGGWGDDYVIRLFKASHLKGYAGALHEQPEFSGKMEKLENEMVHISHRDLSSMLEKTLGFTSYEANLRFKANHPPMSWWRFVRVMTTEFYLRFVKLGAWRDGVEGVIDGMFQVFNTFIIYSRLWELQMAKKSNI
jgi:glycosyltransferase involved in cell wall biosynthesis